MIAYHFKPFMLFLCEVFVSYPFFKVSVDNCTKRFEKKRLYPIANRTSDMRSVRCSVFPRTFSGARLLSANHKLYPHLHRQGVGLGLSARLDQ